MKKLLFTLASYLYALLTAGRRIFYRLGFLKVYRLPVPVVVVGNIVAGGAGKTPIVIELVKHCQRQGLKVGVISRGYGRDSKGCKSVEEKSTAKEVGDEPLLISQKARCSVVVSASRFEAGTCLLKNNPDTQLIICDDGLTHYALWRDVEICVFDERGLAGGFLLPKGLMREVWPRRQVKRAQAGVCPQLVISSCREITGYEIKRELADVAVNALGDRKSLSAWKKIEKETGQIWVCAGIAQPKKFFQMLKGLGVVAQREISLPDHADFQSFAFPSESVELLCTEKDAVKLWEKYPYIWAVELVVTIVPAFYRQFDSNMTHLLK